MDQGTPTNDEEAAVPTNARLQRPPTWNPVPSFLFIALVLFMLMSHNGDEFLARHQYQDALQSLTYQLNNYTAWMSGAPSNFSLPDVDPTLDPLLNKFYTSGSVLDRHRFSYHPNVTGFIHGDAELVNITAAASNNTLAWNNEAKLYIDGQNSTLMTETLGSWRWNSTSKIALSAIEKKPSEGGALAVTIIHGKIELTDPSEAENLRLDFEGVHFITNGSIYGLARTYGSIDIRILPSLVPESARNVTAKLIQPELEARINKLRDLIDDGVVETDSASEAPRSGCSFSFYAQMEPQPYPESSMLELEEELQNPTGVWTISPPQLSLTGVLLSKECGILLKVKNTEGLRSRMFFRKVTTYAGWTGLSYLLLLVLFAQQMSISRTPSGVSRVSLFSFLSQSALDSVSFAGHITFGILAEGRPSLSLIAPAFIACILFIQEAQFSVLIYHIQGPSSFRWFLPSPSPQNTPPPTSFPAFLVHHVRTDPQARLWLAMIVSLFFIVRVILSPTFSMIFVAITYSCIWLPQIVRSVQRGRSSGLSTPYVMGTTVCRLFTALYFLACPKNALEIEPRSWIWVLSALVFLQALIVIAQNRFGPTFFLPQRFTQSQVYDYHPPMPLPDPESPEKSLGDCSICMDAIILDRPLLFKSGDTENVDEKSRLTGVGTMLNAMQGVGASAARKNYSLAPCMHLFHTDCLEKWLAIKNICPQCRRPLPPL